MSRCVQDPGTYSPRHADPRLLAIPTSCSRVADYNPDYDTLSGISSPSRVGGPLYVPLSLVATKEHSNETAGDKPEEGGDDVKSSWPLWVGLHT